MSETILFYPKTVTYPIGHCDLNARSKRLCCGLTNLCGLSERLSIDRRRRTTGCSLCQYISGRYTHCHSHVHANNYADGNADSNRYKYSHSDNDSDAKFYCHIYTNGDSDCNIHGNGYTYSDTDQRQPLFALCTALKG